MQCKNSAENWLVCALAEHDAAAAASALAVFGENSFGNETLKYSRHFVEGLIARMTKDDAKARAAIHCCATRNRRNSFAPILTMLVPFACLV